MSKLRQSVDSLRVTRRRSRPQLVEAALASGVESSGDAATSNRDHEFLQVSVEVAKRELGFLSVGPDVVFGTEVSMCYVSVYVGNGPRVGRQSCGVMVRTEVIGLMLLI